AKAKRSRLGLGRRVRTEEFALFNQEFTALIRAGLTVLDALALASDRPDSPALGKILSRVHADVRDGLSLSEACARHPEAFDAMYLAAVRTGEKTGDLAAVFARHQEYLRHRVALRKKVAQALAYPVFLLIALAIILAVLFAFVMPRFVAMYADLGAALPLPTRVLLSIVDRFYITAPAVGPCGGVFAGAGRRGLSSEAAQRRLDRIRERLPYVGELSRIASTAQLARSLSALLGGGTPLVEALRTAAGSLDRRVDLDRL